MKSFLGNFLVFLCLVSLCMLWGFSIGVSHMQKEAVLQGVAEYQHDTQGNSKFVWKKRILDEGIKIFEAHSFSGQDPLKGVKGLFWPE